MNLSTAIHLGSSFQAALGLTIWLCRHLNAPISWFPTLFSSGSSYQKLYSETLCETGPIRMNTEIPDMLHLVKLSQNGDWFVSCSHVSYPSPPVLRMLHSTLLCYTILYFTLQYVTAQYTVHSSFLSSILVSYSVFVTSLFIYSLRNKKSSSLRLHSIQMQRPEFSVFYLKIAYTMKNPNLKFNLQKYKALSKREQYNTN